MAEDTHRFDPDWTISPAATLREIMDGQRWTIRDVAEATGVSHGRVHQYLHGDAYPASWAVAFADAVGVSPEFIWNLQCNYQLDLAKGKTDMSEHANTPKEDY